MAQADPKMVARASADTSSARVLYIGGAGRSGSTVLERLAGSLPGAFGAGEITYLWDRGLIQNQLCGCNTPFRECPFWRQVIEEAFGSTVACDAREIEQTRQSALAHRRLFQLERPWLRTPGLRRELRDYAQVVQRVLMAIHKVSGCTHIVDSSKYPTDACLLQEIPSVDVDLVQMVRHPAAVAYAWQKKKRRPEIHWKEEYFPQYHWLKTTTAWKLFNRSLEKLGKRTHSYTLVTYDELVAKPLETMTRICHLTGIDSSELTQWLDGTTATFGDNHTISGNTIRFQRGPVEIKMDNAWESEMNSSQRRWVEWLTRSQRQRYGLS